MKKITKAEMKNAMRGHISGTVIKTTEKAIDFEFYDQKSERMTKKWIPKSAITSSIKTVADGMGDFFFELNRIGHSNFDINELTFLRLKDWAFKKIILGIEEQEEHHEKEDYNDWEREEDEDFKMAYDL
tara:strand:- start:5245 stop:5631 length:387 start_codon:yes stop_codon:yes gene_type:complete